MSRAAIGVSGWRGRIAPLAETVWAPLVVALALRLIGLNRFGLWQDEAFSVWLARQPVDAITAFDDVHPPLYYLLLHAWLRGGDSEVWVRLPSVASGVLAVAATYALGTHLFGRSTGALAAWLLALSSWHVWYSQEARMYALAGAAGVAAAWLGASWLREPGGWRGAAWAGGYVAAMAVALYADFSSLLSWVGVAVGVWVLRAPPRKIVACDGPDRSRIERAPDSNFGGRAARVNPSAWLLAGWAGLQAAVAALASGELARVGAAATRLLADPRVTELGPIAIGAGIATIGAAAVWLIRSTRTPAGIAVASLALWLGACLLVPVPTGLSAKRALVVLAPALCLATARAAHGRRARFVVVCAAVASLVAAAVLLQKEGWRETVAQVRAGPADAPVLLEAHGGAFAFDYYDRGRSRARAVGPADAEERLANELAGEPYVWLIRSSTRWLDPREELAAWLDRRLVLRAEWPYYNSDLRLYERR